MSRKKFTLSILFGVSFFLNGFSQASNEFTFEKFIQLVQANHPILLQANLIPESARQNLRMARGGFDPVLQSSYQQKNFDDKNYWSEWETKLKVPTWYGITAEAGYEWYRGEYLDPSRTNPAIGLPSLGLSVTLLKGLVIDERRAILKQAKLIQQASVYEQIAALNDLYKSLVKDYWDWAFAYNQVQIFNTSITLANQRLDGIRYSFLQGDKPAVDTLEALIVLQTRQASLIEAQIQLNTQRLKLSNHLWKDGITPLEMDTSLVPEGMANQAPQLLLTNDSIQNVLMQIQNIQPDVAILDFNIRQLEIDRKLKINKLLPQLDASYNFLYNENNTANYFTDNYKVGVQFKFPIFLRAERGSLGLTKIKLQESTYKLQFKTQEMRSKIQSLYVEYQGMLQQIDIFRSMVVNYRNLLLAEQQKFDNGESSIFLLNSREIKLIEAELKFSEVIAKFYKLESELIATIGLWNRPPTN